MTPLYTYDGNGNPLGVFIPILDWNNIIEKHPDIEELPQWEKDMIDQRLDYIKKHPGNFISMDDFNAELDREDNA